MCVYLYFRLNLTKEDQDYAEYIYIQPQYRIAPYIVGMFTGYIFYKTRGTFKLPGVNQ